jgi:hypothetical protein
MMVVAMVMVPVTVADRERKSLGASDLWQHKARGQSKSQQTRQLEKASVHIPFHRHTGPTKLTVLALVVVVRARLFEQKAQRQQRMGMVSALGHSGGNFFALFASFCSKKDWPHGHNPA